MFKGKKGLFAIVATCRTSCHGHLPSRLSFSGPLIIGFGAKDRCPQAITILTRSQTFQYYNICKIYNGLDKFSIVGQTVGRTLRWRKGVSRPYNAHIALWVWVWVSQRRVLHDLNTHQNFNISRIWYVRRENGLHIKVVTWNPFYHGHLPSRLSFSGPLIIGLRCQGSVPAGWNNSDTNSRYFQNDNVCNIYNWQGKHPCVGQTAGRYPELKNGVNINAQSALGGGFGFGTIACSARSEHPPNFEHISHMIRSKGKLTPYDSRDLAPLLSRSLVEPSASFSDGLKDSFVTLVCGLKYRCLRAENFLMRISSIFKSKICSTYSKHSDSFNV